MRLAFLRRVYSIVFVQLGATAAIIAALRANPQVLYAIVRRVGQGKTCCQSRRNQRPALPN